MPSDPGSGLAFALAYLAGLVVLVFVLAWLEGPSRRRQQVGAWFQRRFADGSPPLRSGRHRAPGSWSPRPVVPAPLETGTAPPTDPRTPLT